jgi:RNA polymerase sigma factor (sigma-70 family)
LRKKLRIWLSRSLSCGAMSNEKWQQIEDLNAYIYTMARNLALKDQAQSRRNQPIETELLESVADSNPGHNPEQLARDAELFKQLKGQLGPEDRVIFQLLYEFGFNSKEIAAKLGKSDGAVRQRISRMGRKLRDNLVEANRQNASRSTSNRTSMVPVQGTQP